MSCLLFPNFTWIFYSLLRLDLIVAPSSLLKRIIQCHIVLPRRDEWRWEWRTHGHGLSLHQISDDFWCWQCYPNFTPPRLQPANCCWAPKVRQMQNGFSRYDFHLFATLVFQLGTSRSFDFCWWSSISSYHPAFTVANIDHIDHFHLICDWRIGSHQSSPKPWGQMGVSNTEFSIQNFDHIWRVRARSTDPPRPYELGAFPYPLNQWFMESLMYKMISQNDVWITMSLKVSWK